MQLHAVPVAPRVLPAVPGVVASFSALVALVLRVEGVHTSAGRRSVVPAPAAAGRQLHADTTAADRPVGKEGGRQGREGWCKIYVMKDILHWHSGNSIILSLLQLKEPI